MLSVRSQSNPARDGESVSGDHRRALSAGVDRSQLPRQAQSRLPAAAILTAAAMLRAGRAPRLHRAALCQLRSFLPPCSPLTASSPSSFPPSCSWARQRVSSENNYEIGIKCFKGQILPFDSCPPFSAWSFLPCFAVGFFVSYLPGGIRQWQHLFCCSPGATGMARRPLCH